MTKIAALTDIPDLVSLSKYDQACGESLERSCCGGPLLSLGASLRAKLSGSKLTMQGKLGGYLQCISFAFLLLLFACLGLPQFASDKEGLALVSLTSLTFFV